MMVLSLQQEMPLAVVHGQPVLQIPQDLYIPPDALEVILDAFEGPLDLLLYLIRRQNLDVLDIPVAEITRQYVEYITVMRELRFELAAEYLVMAAILGAVTAFVSQVGDIFESACKRHFKVKDSGTLIPGHGGILDRVDGLLFATVFVAGVGFARYGDLGQIAHFLL